MLNDVYRQQQARGESNLRGSGYKALAKRSVFIFKQYQARDFLLPGRCGGLIAFLVVAPFLQGID
jgi:hypothetical protein